MQASAVHGAHQDTIVNTVTAAITADSITAPNAPVVQTMLPAQSTITPPRDQYLENQANPETIQKTNAIFRHWAALNTTWTARANMYLPATVIGADKSATICRHVF